MNVLISGGTAGLGRELAKQLADRGDHVFVFSRHPIKDDQIAPNVITIQADVSNPQQLRMLKENLAARRVVIDVVINNAGISEINAPYQAPYLGNRWREIVATNIEGPLNLLELFIDDLLQSKSPMVINMTSILAHYPTGFSAVYAGSKAFLSAISKSLSSIQSTKPIRVIEVILPVLDTPMSANFPMNGRKKLPPAVAAQHIIRGIEQGKTEIRIGDAELLLRLKRVIPGVIQNNINRMSNDFIRNAS